MRTRPRLSVLLFALVSLAGSSLVGACSNQGEGEPCSPYSDDCQSDLECTLVSGNNNGYRCCPIPPAQPSVNNICAPNNTGVNNSNPPPSEAGTDAGVDGDADASVSVPEASVEAAVEASSDATAEEGGGDGGTDSASPDAADGASE
jgi:hypothetical protein